ncbi:MAG TPA: site-specific integrase, partial [Thermodesulfobacteriota bacterium]|nr:site-specific integrase [Thermodesulfobacteriota bacterium]
EKIEGAWWCFLCRREVKQERKNKATGVYLRGKVYWVKYSVNGKPRMENSHCGPGQLKAAIKFRNSKMGDIAKGIIPSLRMDKTSFEDLAKLITDDYINKKRKSIETLGYHLQHLRKFFGDYRAANITTMKIQEYVDYRREEEVQDSTIRLELSDLRRMFTIAYEETTPPKVSAIPRFPKLEKGSVREGYFELEEFLPLRQALPPYLRTLTTLAFKRGMRRGEILGLRWDKHKIDLMEGEINLGMWDTKNKQPRIIPLDAELLELFKFQRMERDQRFPSCPWVFFGEKGERIKDFRSAWRSACLKVGLCQPLLDEQGQPVKDEKGEVVLVPNKLFHDFRRTAVRNMVRAGISERVAMMISGHKTRAVFDRYNIVDTRDVKKASQRLSEFLAGGEKKVKKQDFERVQNKNGLQDQPVTH